MDISAYVQYRLRSSSILPEFRDLIVGCLSSNYSITQEFLLEPQDRTKQKLRTWVNQIVGFRLMAPLVLDIIQTGHWTLGW